MWRVHKRFDDFHKLHLQLEDLVCQSTGWITVPKHWLASHVAEFPRKYMTKCKGKALTHRKCALELWLQAVVSKSQRLASTPKAVQTGWDSKVCDFLEWESVVKQHLHIDLAKIMQSASAPAFTEIEDAATNVILKGEAANLSEEEEQDLERRKRQITQNIFEIMEGGAEANSKAEAAKAEEKIEHKFEVHSADVKLNVKQEVVRCEAELQEADASLCDVMEPQMQSDAEQTEVIADLEQEERYRAEEEEAAKQLEHWLHQQAQCKAGQMEAERSWKPQVIDTAVQAQTPLQTYYPGFKAQGSEMACCADGLLDQVVAAQAAGILALSREPCLQDVPAAALTCKVMPRVALVSA